MKISPLLFFHIKRRSPQARKLSKPEIEKRLEDVLNEFYSYGYHIRFLWFMDWGRSVPDAMAGKENRIYFNSEWASIIVSEPEESRNAFRMTMGHEMAHLSEQFHSDAKVYANGHFVKWVNEVRADFSGMYLFLEGNKEEAVKALQFKASRYRKKDEDAYAHPSWEKRIDYISNYEYDEKLIRRIAEDAMLTDESVINKAIEFSKKQIFNEG